MVNGAEFLSHGGEMGDRIRAFPWHEHALGERTRWPRELKTAVQIILATHHPAVVLWGASLHCVYNDAYGGGLDHRKRPRALGAPAREIHEDVWHHFGPRIEQVVGGGHTIWIEDELIPMSRHGGAADLYWTYSFGPLPDPAAPNGIGGVLGLCSDTTPSVATRRLLEEQAERFAALERQMAERTGQLIARENLIRTVYEHSSECHAVLRETAAGSFSYEEINPATLRLYGKSRDEVVGRTVNDIFGVDGARDINRHLRTCLERGRPYHYERGQGEGVVEAIATPVAGDDGALRRVIVTARDVTESRRLEQQLRESQKMEAVGQLTGGLAHDFNNLLAGIGGSLEVLKLLLQQGRIDELDRYVESGRGGVRRAAALTHRLLAFARRQTLDPQPTDLNRLVTGMEELVRRTVGPSIAVEVAGAAGLWTTLVDQNQVETALLNLCINARDAMPGGGRLTIETANRWIDERGARQRDIPAGQYLALSVTDSGTGMTADVVARAFDPFFTTKPLGQGTGLGLSMVYGFARQSSGQVRIYSEPGKGTMVCLYLPRYCGESERPAAAFQPAAAHHPGAGECVLIVDDEPTVRLVASEILRQRGYATLEADDAAKALTVLQSSQRVDLMITDVGLPGGLNGRQLADAGRGLRPLLKVLFITGFAENAVISHGHLDPGFHILTKPFELEELARRAAEILSE